MIVKTALRLRKLFFAALLVFLCTTACFFASAAQDEIDQFNQKLLDNAFKAIEKKQDAKANGFLSKFLESHPNHREALLAFAQLSARLGNYADADIAFSRILRREPDNVDILYQSGMNKWRLKQNYEAQEILFRASANAGLSPRQKAEAEDVLKTIYSDWNVFHVMKEHDDVVAQERFHTFHIAANPGTAVVSYALRGFCRHWLGKIAEAEEDFKKALALGGMEDDLAAGVRRSLESIENDRENKRQAAILEEVRARVGELEEKKDLEGLERYFDELVEQGKAPAYALLRRGLLRLDKGELPDAEADLTSALEKTRDKRDEAVIRQGLEKIGILRAAMQAAGPGAEAAEPDKDSVAYANSLFISGMRKHFEKKGHEAQDLLHKALVHGGLDEKTADMARRTLDELYSDWAVFEQMKNHGDVAAQKRFHSSQIGKRPDQAAVSYALRGFLLHQEQDLAGARSDFEKALAIGGMNDGLTASVERSLGYVTARQAELEREPGQPKVTARSGAALPRDAVGGFTIWTYFKKSARLMQQGAYDQAAEVLRHAQRYARKPEERGILYWHMGEVAWHKGDTEAGAKEFERALDLLKIPFYRSGALVRLADYNERVGKADQAERLAGLAAAIYPEPWRLEQVSAIYLRLKMPEKAVALYQQALKGEWTPAKKADTYKGLAMVYKSMRDADNYRAALNEYLKLVPDGQLNVSEDDRARLAYYQGELLYLDGKKAEALQKYQEAGRILKDSALIGDIYLKAADYMIETGRMEEAEILAEQYATLFPEDPWRNRHVEGIFQRTKNPKKAMFYARRAYDLTRDRDPEQIRSLAFKYLANEDKENFQALHREYIDTLYEQLEKAKADAPPELIERLWSARQIQTAAECAWGFNSYNFGNFGDDNTHYTGFVNELYTYIKIPYSDLNAKLYAQLNGVYGAYYSGTWFDEARTGQGNWEAKSDLNDSLYGLVGIKSNPIKLIPHLGFAAEYVYPLATSREEDFRLRSIYYRSWGDTPRPLDWRWTYGQVWADAIYTTRENMIKAQGDFRLGETFCFEMDRNLLLYPFSRIGWSYMGHHTEKSKRWTMEAGPGIGFKYFFYEDRRHAPRASLEFNIGYYFGLSHEKPDGVGINVNFSF